jgi:hypothetical protein
MAPGRIGTLQSADRQAVFNSAKRLGLDPYEFGALVHQESGFRPNVWGGASGQYRGLIQFGPGARKEVGLPDKPMTISEQLPYVEKYFQQRGYKPGMGIAKAYATVLGGNPNVSLKAKDSFGTSVESSLPRFKKGGQLYQRAQATLGDPLTGTVQNPQQLATVPAQQPQQTATAQTPGGITYNVYIDESDQPVQRDPMDFLQKIIQKPERQRYSPAEIATALTSAAVTAPNYDFGLNPWRQ